MDFFGIGPLNLLIILAVALMVFGPDRLPEVAAKAGKLVRELREYASNVTDEFSGEFAEIQEQFGGIRDEARNFGEEVRDHATGVGASFRNLAPNGDRAAQATIDGVNEPPPAQKLPENIVPLGGATARPRVDDYKPT